MTNLAQFYSFKWKSATFGRTKKVDFSWIRPQNFIVVGRSSRTLEGGPGALDSIVRGEVVGESFHIDYWVGAVVGTFGDIACLYSGVDKASIDRSQGELDCVTDVMVLLDNSTTARPTALKGLSCTIGLSENASTTPVADCTESKA